MSATKNIDTISNTKLILVDDNVAFRSALRKLLEIQYGCKIMAEASDGKEFLNLSGLVYADIVIMDLMMPNMDGLTAAKQINFTYPTLKIIAVTMHYDKTYLQDLIMRGFKGCIFKSNLYDHIYEAIDMVRNGKLFFPKELLLKQCIKH